MSMTAQTELLSGLIFRGLQGEIDYPAMLEIVRSSRQADQHDEPVSLENFQRDYAPTDEFDPSRQVILVCVPGEAAPVGYSRMGWYASNPDNRLYYHYGYLKADYRGTGVWEALVQQSEARLRVIASQHAPVAARSFQAWASDYQKDWIAVLDRTGYQVVRRFNNMLRPLDEIPQIPLPSGFSVHPVQPDEMRRVWEAQKEMNDGLFENVVEDWLDEKYPEWLANPGHTPHLWQVAWEGEQLAGMVLARIDAEDNEKHQRRRGLTEHIYVRPAWRKRGLASALIARSLQVLKDHGMQEAELGVDAENESAAYRLYQQLGYQTFYTDIWFRKPMDA